jgi:gluconolactonase
MKRFLIGGLLALLASEAGSAALALSAVEGPASTRGPLDGRPDAIVDLNTADGLQAVRGAWTFQDAAPGSAIVPVAAGGLLERRGPGGTSAAWYRIRVTIPESVGGLATAGTAAVFEIVVDDYAEVWVNGALPRSLGLSGASLVGGFNVPNRVVLTREARAGQTFDIQVYAINGPISAPPANFIWVRSASIDFYKADSTGRRVDVAVERKSPALDAILPADLALERLATGFQFTEGPVWVATERSLLFSDPNDNTIYRWNDDTGVSIFRVKSGYSGANVGEYRQPGSNGLALDAEGRLTIAEHGNRRISRLEPKGQVTVLADRYEGRRLNSPNDLVYKSDGALYFTDPPFGLPRVYDDPRKELPHQGVYRLKDGVVTLLSTELKGPNGIAFSPDERYLYVANWDEQRKVVMRYEVSTDGTLAKGRVFFDMTGAPGEEALDGVKVDRAGNLFVSGPGGLWILSAKGVHLGTVKGPELAANMAWGDEDGKTLYLTARSSLYRMRVLTGAGSATLSTMR